MQHGLHIGIDIREACEPKRTGKGQWSHGFIEELLQRDIGLTLISDTPLPDEWKSFLVRKHGACRQFVAFPQRGAGWHWTVAQFLKADNDIDVYVSPTSYIVPSLVGKSVRCVPIVHDLIAFRREPHDMKAKAIERLTLGRIVKNAAHLCTVSYTTKMDLLKRFHSLDPARVTPIFSGPTFDDTTHGIPDGQTIICIATLSPRKNQERLIEAYAALPSSLREHYRLVLVGNRGWKDASILSRIEQTEGVEWKQYLPDTDCRELLCRATILAFPSLYEGFGMPVLDAFRLGVPILTSDRGSLKEVADDAAIFVDPESVASIASGLERILTDAKLRQSFITKGLDRATQFTWPKTVDLFLEAIG